MTAATIDTAIALANGVQSGDTGLRARFRIDWRPGSYPTKNVIAETRGGDPNSVIVVGAHLDSVGTGPGINDNGSGSAGILELARKLQAFKLQHKVRFVWFSAEESGLLGSEAYVASLPAAERAKIKAMLNFDMIGSPNFVRFVYDGDLSDSEPPPGGAPAGSAEIEALFLDYFASQGLPTEPTAFDGRSDYGPFIAAGIPAGGLFTGAEEIKTPAAGCGLRRNRGPAVRPVLPPGLRQHHEPQPQGVGADGRRRRPRDAHAGPAPGTAAPERRARGPEPHRAADERWSRRAGTAPGRGQLTRSARLERRSDHTSRARGGQSQATGRTRRPQRNGASRRSVGPSKRSEGSRSTRVPSAVRAVMRARCAPRQKCVPQPKA